MSNINKEMKQPMLPSEKLQMGHQAILLEDARQVLKETRLGTEKHRQMSVGGAENTGDDMLVLGDHTTHVYPAEKTDWGKLILGAGLLASGVGAPLGGFLVWQGLKEQLPASVTKPVLEKVLDRADQDTVIDWELGGGVDFDPRETE